MKKIFIAIILYFIFAPTVFSQSTDPETLKGLQSVFVLVEPLDSDVEANGLTTFAIQFDAELQLKKAGIKMVSKPLNYGGSVGVLYIQVSTHRVKGIKSLYAYHVAANIQQPAMLLRPPQTINLATTYDIPGVTGTVGSRNLRTIRDTVSGMIDIFINDYLAMNPKP